MTGTLLTKALDRYNREVSTKKKSHAVESFRIAALQRSWLAAIPVNKITSTDLAKYRDQRLATINPRTGKLISAGTVRVELSLLSAVFNMCRREWRYCTSNPTENVTKPKPAPGRTRRISTREDRAILSWASRYRNSEFFSVYVIAIETAMRQSEILKLEWQRIDLKRRVILLEDTKNGSSRSIPLSIRARDAILRLGRQRAGRVFTYAAAGFKSAWRTMTSQLNLIDLKFHDVRHEAVSRLFELGVLDMMEVAAISGHKTLSMLKRYTHLRAERLVKKLDQAHRKTRLSVDDLIVSYPATVQRVDDRYILTFPDFDRLQVDALNLNEATQKASDALLRRISTMAARRLPLPVCDISSHNELNDPSTISIDALSINDEELPTVFSGQ